MNQDYAAGIPTTSSITESGSSRPLTQTHTMPSNEQMRQSHPVRSSNQVFPYINRFLFVQTPMNQNRNAGGPATSSAAETGSSSLHATQMDNTVPWDTQFSVFRAPPPPAPRTVSLYIACHTYSKLVTHTAIRRLLVLQIRPLSSHQGAAQHVRQGGTVNPSQPVALMELDTDVGGTRGHNETHVSSGATTFPAQAQRDVFQFPPAHHLPFMPQATRTIPREPPSRMTFNFEPQPQPTSATWNTNRQERRRQVIDHVREPREFSRSVCHFSFMVSYRRLI